MDWTGLLAIILLLILPRDLLTGTIMETKLSRNIASFPRNRCKICNIFPSRDVMQHDACSVHLCKVVALSPDTVLSPEEGKEG